MDSSATAEQIGASEGGLAAMVSSLNAQMTIYGTTGENHWDFGYPSCMILRDIMCKIFEEQYEKSPKIEAIHAGLECGIFCGKRPRLDCVSFGPDIFDIHTPKERLSISSAKRTWDFLLNVLENLKIEK